jgi:hypothetical protein
MRRLAGAALVIVGAGAFAACLRSAFTGMRNVMITDGGFCASGGPYVIAHQCSGADMRLLLVGILGGLVAVAVYSGGTSSMGSPTSSAGLLCWGGLFGALGWNFISLVIHPSAGQGSATGWLVCGVVFWAIAAGGLVALFGVLTGELRSGNGRSGNGPSRVVSGPPLVRAVIPQGIEITPEPGFGGWPASGPTALGLSGAVTDAVGPPRTSAWSRVGAWLITSAVGAAAGLAIGSLLVSALR